MASHPQQEACYSFWKGLGHLSSRWVDAEDFAVGNALEGPRDRTGEKMLALGCIEVLTPEEKPRTWRISEKAWQAIVAYEKNLMLGRKSPALVSHPSVLC